MKENTKEKSNILGFKLSRNVYHLYLNFKLLPLHLKFRIILRIAILQTFVNKEMYYVNIALTPSFQCFARLYFHQKPFHPKLRNEKVRR